MQDLETEERERESGGTSGGGGGVESGREAVNGSTAGPLLVSVCGPVHPCMGPSLSLYGALFILVWGPVHHNPSLNQNQAPRVLLSPRMEVEGTRGSRDREDHYG